MTTAFSLILTSFSLNAHADLIPSNDNDFYYRIGGGQSAPAPAYDGTTRVPLNAEAEVGLGLNCGVFNPYLSMINSLNGIKNSLQNIQQQVIHHATSAVTLFPMYLIARADPSLYNLLNNGILGARRDLELSTKSCQAMQSEVAGGHNPYADWARISMGDDWKYRMSLAGTNVANSDINVVKQKIEKESGSNGVPWVQGEHIGRKAPYAGGRGQASIAVVRDISIAGYNVILQMGRQYDDQSSPLSNHANAHLVDTWPNPKVAANWIVSVVGEENITTYSSGDKQMIPGVGLLPHARQLSATIHQHLKDLVSNKEAITIPHLQAVSAPHVMINSKVIDAMRQQAPLSQAIIIEKLAQEVATSKLIDQALLARHILETGSQIPAIYSNQAAQKIVKRVIQRLNEEIVNLLFHVKVRKALVSHTVSELLSEVQQEGRNRTGIQPSNLSMPVMKQGAIEVKG